MIRKTVTQFRELQRVTGPAITLLMVCLALVAFTTWARAQSPEQQVFQPTVDVSARAPAEVVTWVDWTDGSGRVSVTVDAAAADSYSVYLPGLDLTRVALRYDEDLGQHTGAIPLPLTAPRVGHFTLRVLDQGGRAWDFGVRVAAPGPKSA